MIVVIFISNLIDAPTIMNQFRKSIVEKILLAVCAIVVVAQIVLVGISYPSLPETIPIHYGITGEADNFAPKYTIWIMVSISSAIISFLYFQQSRGNKIKINWPIKKENEVEVQVFVLKWLRVLTLVIACLLFYILSGTILVALGKAKQLNPFIMLTLTIFLILVVFGGIIRMQEINAGRKKA